MTCKHELKDGCAINAAYCPAFWCKFHGTPQAVIQIQGEQQTALFNSRAKKTRMLQASAPRGQKRTEAMGHGVTRSTEDEVIE